MKDDTVISCSFDKDPGETIPPINIIRQIDFGETRWILVIEKEVPTRACCHSSASLNSLTVGQATFRTLAASQYWRHCIHGQGAMVTVRPSINTISLGYSLLSRAKATQT